MFAFVGLLLVLPAFLLRLMFSRSGWNDIAAVYGVDEPYMGTWTDDQPVKIGWMGLSGISVGATRDFLYLAMPWPSSQYFSTLQLPWSDLKMAQKLESLGRELIELKFEAVDVPVSFEETTIEEVFPIRIIKQIGEWKANGKSKDRD